MLQIVSGSKHKDRGPLYVCQDVNAYVFELTERDGGVSFILDEGRQAYVCCFEGSIDINQYPSLGERDSLKISGRADIKFSLASDRAHFIIIEMQ